MRRTSLLVPLASVIGLFVACSNGDDPAPSTTPQTDSGSSDDSSQSEVGAETSADATDDASETSTDAITPDTAPPLSPGWDPRFALPGMQALSGPGGVDAVIVTPKRWIYVGGSFHHAGSTPAKNVAVWNGLKWNALGDGLPGRVTALAATATEEVYAVVDDGTTSKLWKWDKTAWGDLGVTVDARIRSIDVAIDGTVWIAGWFTKVNGVTAKSVARWKSGTWSAVGSGIAQALEVVRVTPSGACVGGGAEGTDVGVSCWDGTKWTSRKANLVHGYVKTLRLDAKGTLYAGGNIDAGGVETDYSPSGGIVKWNESTKKWDLVGGGVSSAFGGPGDVADIATFGDKVYVTGVMADAGGLFVRGIAMWDGKKWWDLDGGLGKAWGAAGLDITYARTLAIDDGGELYTGGMMTRAGALNVMDIAHWTGTEWTAVDEPTAVRLGINGNANTVAVGSDGATYVGGGFGWAGRDVPVSNIARLGPDGTWSALGAGLDGEVNDIALTGPDVYVAGRFGGSGTSSSGAPLVPARGIAHWNGKSWSSVGGGVNGNARVIEIAPDNNIWVGGEFEAAGTKVVNKIAMWDGAQWWDLAGGVGDGMHVSAILFDGGKVYVGGEFTKIGDVSAKNIAMWNGAEWSAVGAGLDGGVYSLAKYAGKIVAGGTFTNHVAAWNGTEWSALGGGIHGTIIPGTDGAPDTETTATITGFGVRGSDLFAIGMFDKAGAIDVHHLAVFDGTAWKKVDGELDDLGIGLFVAKDSLWVAGTFGTAGGIGSVGIGRWIFAK